ncbi:hypothetical protein BX666DRAFT_2003267 [Dichotomocladium elegans]|nr:hypothetical protein BX666DRAFT_2003267 [Dichotomocladium elegans]
MSEEHAHKADPLFDSDVEMELSDLDGDAESDDEVQHAAYHDQHQSETGNDEEKETLNRKPRLPSFKKQNREVSEEENADLARIREELRSRKQSDSQLEDGDEEPKRPDHVQGIFEQKDEGMEFPMGAPMLNVYTSINTSYKSCTG